MVFFYVTIPDFNFEKSKLKNNPIDNTEPKENIKHLRHKLATSSAMTLYSMQEPQDGLGRERRQPKSAHPPLLTRGGCHEMDFTLNDVLWKARTLTENRAESGKQQFKRSHLLAPVLPLFLFHLQRKPHFAMQADPQIGKRCHLLFLAAFSLWFPLPQSHCFPVIHAEETNSAVFTHVGLHLTAFLLEHLNNKTCTFET